ncbi:MAG: protease inhibitor I42 family protein [Eubacteriales bacterium]|nr:protease inhibitor I42 family protein [Eubacteriales bacterium]
MLKKGIVFMLALMVLCSGMALAEEAQSASITLQENPTTGYTWSYVISDEAIIAVTDDGYIADANPEGLVGAGGTHRFTITGIAEGQATVTLTLAQPWDGGEQAATISYNYVVDDQKQVSIVGIEGVPEAYMPDKAVVTLEENPTTGYEWTYTISDESVLTFARDVFQSSADTDGMLAGAGGVHTWVFTGVAQGDAMVAFAYERSWEKTPIATVTYTYHVDENLNVTLTDTQGDPSVTTQAETAD